MISWQTRCCCVYFCDRFRIFRKQAAEARQCSLKHYTMAPKLNPSITKPSARRVRKRKARTEGTVLSGFGSICTKTLIANRFAVSSSSSSSSEDEKNSSSNENRAQEANQKPKKVRVWANLIYLIYSLLEGWTDAASKKGEEAAESIRRACGGNGRGWYKRGWQCRSQFLERTSCFLRLPICTVCGFLSSRLQLLNCTTSFTPNITTPHFPRSNGVQRLIDTHRHQNRNKNPSHHSTSAKLRLN